MSLEKRSPMAKIAQSGHPDYHKPVVKFVKTG
jgi:hypothetical protein